MKEHLFIRDSLDEEEEAMLKEEEWDPNFDFRRLVAQNIPALTLLLLDKDPSSQETCD